MKKKDKNLKFIYTLDHIVVSQSTLSVLEAEPTVCVIQQTVRITVCTALGHSISTSHHASNAPYVIIAINLQLLQDKINAWR